MGPMEDMKCIYPPFLGSDMAKDYWNLLSLTENYFHLICPNITLIKVVSQLWC